MAPWYSEVSKRYATYEAVNQKDINVKRVGIASINNITTGDRGDFEKAPVVDFDLIRRAYETDGYIRQALDKFIYLMFKEGYRIVGENPKAIEYIKTRLRIMSFATGISTEKLLEEIASNLVKYANVIILKARQDIKIPGVKISPAPGEKKPVAGYFVQNISTVEIRRRSNGEVLQYRISSPTREEQKIFDASEVIHIDYGKESGQAFAVPFVWEVLDDVRLLRQLEETVSKMVHKETYPQRDVTVGLEGDGQEASQEEIDKVKEIIENTPEDGVLIHSARVKCNIIGAEGEALNAEPYLRYYEDRVFAGLGVSAVMMGRGEGASRATADNITDQMFDRITSLQRVMADAITNHMFVELLQEGGFDPITNPNDIVMFVFNPVDVNTKIKLELHEVYKWTNNIQSINETRINMNMKPVSDVSSFYTNVIKKPELVVAKTGINDSNSDIGNKLQPTNQYGKKLGPSRAKNSEELSEELSLERIPYMTSFYQYFSDQYDLLGRDIELYISRFYDNKQFDVKKELKMIISILSDSVKRQGGAALLNSLYQAIEETRRKINPYVIPNINYEAAISRINNSLQNDVDRLIDDIYSAILDAIRLKSKEESIKAIGNFMEANKFRVTSIVRNNGFKVYNYGVALCAKGIGKKTVKVKTKCSTCKSFYPSYIDLDVDFYDIIPPAAHPNCDCELEV